MNFIKRAYRYFTENSVIWVALSVFLLICVIDMFDPSYRVSAEHRIYVGAIVVVIFLLIMGYKKTINLTKLKIMNFIDSITMSTLLGVISYFIFSIVFCYSRFKISWLLIIANVLVIVEICRCVIVYVSLKEQKAEQNYNVIDLKQLYDNTLDNSNNNLIFLEEKDVNYDLLDRNKTIMELYNSIRYCKNKGRFIISYTGLWGSGKTTIINIVKSRLPDNEFIIIDEFDAWKYKNEEYLLCSMFDEILKKLKINFSTIEIKHFIQVCCNMVTANTKLKFVNIGIEDKIIKRIKETINKLLEANNQRVVFIIDNLERTNKDNIVLILRTISNILNMDRFIYVLSYDENEMKEIFEQLSINYDYMEKVIQLPLRIPDNSDKKIKEVCSECLYNLLEHYGVSKEDVKKYTPVVDLFNSKIKNLRSFKRKVNSIFNASFYENGNLNKSDLFMIELINQENEKLYNEIKSNPEYFISENYNKIYGMMDWDTDNYNKNATTYFDRLFNTDDNKDYIDILSLLFPRVKKYMENRDRENPVIFINKRPIYTEEIQEQQRKSNTERRISNAKFFELYFIKQENDFIEIDNRVKECIGKINTMKAYTYPDFDGINVITDLIENLIFLYEGTKQRDILEVLELYLKEISKNNLFVLLSFLIIQDSISNKQFFFEANAKDRAEIICAKLIKNINDKDFEIFKSIVRVSYRNLSFLHKVAYWLNPKDKFDLSDTDQQRYDELNICLNELIGNIENKKINMYNKEYYSRGNIYYLLKNEKHKSQIVYIDDTSIFRFLADMIMTSIGTNGYGYTINRKTLEKFLTYDDVDAIIKKVNLDEISLSEKFIYEVYIKSKKQELSEEETTVYSNNYIDIEHI